MITRLTTYAKAPELLSSSMSLGNWFTIKTHDNESTPTLEGFSAGRLSFRYFWLLEVLAEGILNNKNATKL